MERPIGFQVLEFSLKVLVPCWFQRECIATGLVKKKKHKNILVGFKENMSLLGSFFLLFFVSADVFANFFVERGNVCRENLDARGAVFEKGGSMAYAHMLPLGPVSHSLSIFEEGSLTVKRPHMKPSKERRWETAIDF